LPDDAALKQHFFGQTQAQRKPEIEPDGMRNEIKSSCCVASKVSSRRPRRSTSMTIVISHETARRIASWRSYLPGTTFDDEWAPQIATVVRVTRRTATRSAAIGLWKSRQAAQQAIYVSSVMPPPKTFASAIRNHWAIQNQNHRVLSATSK